MKIELSIDKALLKAIDDELVKIDAMVRGKAVDAGLRSVGKNIGQRTKAMLPSPGYTRFTRTSNQAYHDREGQKPLGDTDDAEVTTPNRSIHGKICRMKNPTHNRFNLPRSSVVVKQNTDINNRTHHRTRTSTQACSHISPHSPCDCHLAIDHRFERRIKSTASDRIASLVHERSNLSHQLPPESRHLVRLCPKSACHVDLDNAWAIGQRRRVIVEINRRRPPLWNCPILGRIKRLRDLGGIEIRNRLNADKRAADHMHGHATRKFVQAQLPLLVDQRHLAASLDVLDGGRQVSTRAEYQQRIIFGMIDLNMSLQIVLGHRPNRIDFT